MDKNTIKKVALITGASSGLGRYLCSYLAKRDIKIAAIARNKEKLKTLVGEIESDGGTACYYPVDVKDYKALEKAVSQINDKYGRIDILINNAGVDIEKSLEELSGEDIDEVIDTNLKGYIYATRLVAPIMTGSKNYKYIFNVSSMASERGLNNGNGLYYASKFGVNGFGNSISKYLIKNNIHVITLCPGGIDTSWYDKHDWEFGRETLIKPEEIAKLIGFILDSRESTVFQKILFFPSSVIDRW